MTNFIFKSTAADLQKIRQQMVTILDNLRFLRSDLHILDYKLSKLITSSGLQKQVDEFYAKRDEDDPETSSGICSSVPLGDREDMD